MTAAKVRDLRTGLVLPDDPDDRILAETALAHLDLSTERFNYQLDEIPGSRSVEFAYRLMARAAGIAMPETHLFGTRKKQYFSVMRFDRDGDRRIHMHSLSGLPHADHRTPTLDYDGLLIATQVLTKDADGTGA